MNTQMSRADQIVDVLGDKAMGIAVIIQILQKRDPKTPIERLRVSVRAALAKNPSRFERLEDGQTYRVRTAPLATVVDGKWPTKKAFVLDHLHLEPDEVITLGAEHGIKLSKATVWTVRYEAAKQGKDVVRFTQRKSTKTTIVRTETNVTSTTLMEASANSLDELIIQILEEEITVGNVREQIAAVVRPRVQELGRPRVAKIAQEVTQDEVKAFFSNL